jgi:hypothetical protein
MEEFVAAWDEGEECFADVPLKDDGMSGSCVE